MAGRRLAMRRQSGVIPAPAGFWPAFEKRRQLEFRRRASRHVAISVLWPLCQWPVGVQDAGSLIVPGKYRVPAASADPSGLSTMARRLRPRYSLDSAFCISFSQIAYEV